MLELFVLCLNLDCFLVAFRFVSLLRVFLTFWFGFTIDFILVVSGFYFGLSWVLLDFAFAGVPDLAA